MAGHLLKSSNRFTAYSIYPIERKLDRMIVEISSQLLRDGLFDSPKRRCGGAHLEIFKSIRSQLFYLIELKLGRMILDVSPHNRWKPHFSVLPRTCCGARLLESSRSIHSLHYYPIELKLGRMIPVITFHNRTEHDYLFHSRGRCGARF